jgi:hypothetical protein
LTAGWNHAIILLSVSIIHLFSEKLYGMRNLFSEVIDNSIKEVKHNEEEQKNEISETDNIQNE